MQDANGKRTTLKRLINEHSGMLLGVAALFTSDPRAQKELVSAAYEAIMDAPGLGALYGEFIALLFERFQADGQSALKLHRVRDSLLRYVAAAERASAMGNAAAPPLALFLGGVRLAPIDNAMAQRLMARYDTRVRERIEQSRAKSVKARREHAQAATPRRRAAPDGEKPASNRTLARRGGLIAALVVLATAAIIIALIALEGADTPQNSGDIVETPIIVVPLDEPSPSPAVTPAASPSPTASPTPVATLTPVTPTAAPSPSKRPTPSPTERPTPSPSPRITRTPAPSPSYTLAPTPQPTAEPAIPPTLEPTLPPDEPPVIETYEPEI